MLTIQDVEAIETQEELDVLLKDGKTLGKLAIKLMIKRGLKVNS